MRLPVRLHLLAALALALAAAPSAADAEVVTAVRATGDLVITWQGDSARGCAERGVCDVRGSLAVTLRSRFADGEAPARSLADGGDFVPVGLMAAGGVVRVLRGPADDPAGVCVDELGVDALRLLADAETPRRLVLGRTEYLDDPELSSGRCAGPRPTDLANALPTVTLPRGQLRRGNTRLDLRSVRSFTAGAFTGEVRSTVVADVRRRRVDRGVGDGGLDEPSGRGHDDGARGGRVDLLQATYEVERTAGTLSAALTPGPAPDCLVLDACAQTGQLTLTVPPTTDNESLSLTAARRARGPVRPTRARMLRVLAAGGLRGFFGGGFPVEPRPGLLRAEVASGCLDERPVGLGWLEADTGRSERQVRLERAREPEVALRSRCPGPGRADLIGGAPLAAARLPLGAFAARRLTVRLTPPAPLGGALVVELRRTGTRVLRIREDGPGIPGLLG